MLISNLNQFNASAGTACRIRCGHGEGGIFLKNRNDSRLSKRLGHSSKRRKKEHDFLRLMFLFNRVKSLNFD